MREVVAVAACVLVGACSFLAPDPVLGSRPLGIVVINDSFRPERIVIKQQGNGAIVGAATPSVVPPKTRVHVTLDVPRGSDWYLTFDPKPPDTEAVMGGDDFGTCSGKVPVEITIAEIFIASWTAPAKLC